MNIEHYPLLCKQQIHELITIIILFSMKSIITIEYSISIIDIEQTMADGVCMRSVCTSDRWLLTSLSSTLSLSPGAHTRSVVPWQIFEYGKYIRFYLALFSNGWTDPAVCVCVCDENPLIMRFNSKYHHTIIVEHYHTHKYMRMVEYMIGQTTSEYEWCKHA